jgi:hypothetical protein
MPSSNYIKILTVSFVLVSLFSLATTGQVLTSNDGFETNLYYFPPSYWNNCDDNMSSGDIQPGAFNNHLPASQGNKYISLVTREFNVPGTVETA